VKLQVLSVRNLLGLDEAEITFEPGVVAIVGPNGSGKSSLLDALVVALFGEPSPVRPVRQSGLVRIGADRGEVSLTFSVASGLYRVSRTFRRNRSQEVLVESFGDGRWEPIASTVQEAADRLASLLSPPFPGSSSDRFARLKDSFLASVFVPQGQVTRLIDATPGERWAVLAAVLGLDDEERLREKARAVLDLALGEEERLEGERMALEERLAAIGEREALLRRRAEAERAIADGEARLGGVKKALDSRRELDRLEGEKASAALELKAASSQLLKVRRLARLNEAAEGLARLRQEGERVGFRRRRLAALERERDGESDGLRAAEARLGKLRQDWRHVEADLAAVERPARKAEAAQALLDARTEEGRLRQELDKGTAEAEGLDRSLAALERSRRTLLRRDLTGSLLALKDSHRAEALRLAQLVSGLSGALLAWLRLLADGDGLVRPGRFRGARALFVASSFREAGLQEHFEAQARSRQRCWDYLRQGQELRSRLAALPPPEEGDDEGPLPDGETLERERLKAVRARDRLEGTLLERKRRLDDLALRRRDREEALGFPDEAFLRACIAAQARREELLAERESLRRCGEASRDDVEKRRLRLVSLDGEIAGTVRALAEAREGLASARSFWKEAADRCGWSRSDLVEALALGGDTLPRGALERALAREEEARRRDEALTRALEAHRKSLPTALPSRADLEAHLAEAEKELRERWSLKARLEEALAAREELRKGRDAVESRRKALLPAVDGARRLFRLTESRSFPRFVGDYLTGRLLQSVNGSLDDKSWRLRAQGGAIEVVEAGGVRPASSLSGGERAFVALLMLRRLAAEVGFQQILFIDEGLAMLDDSHLDRVIDLLGKLGREAFVAVITHDFDVAASFPRQWRLDGGRLVAQEVSS
jgi:exonuclease SbcC